MRRYACSLMYFDNNYIQNVYFALVVDELHLLLNITTKMLENYDGEYLTKKKKLKLFTFINMWIIAQVRTNIDSSLNYDTLFPKWNIFYFYYSKGLHIFECLLFETDDLIMRKNEKHVILCLLEVARRGAKFGK